MPENCDQSSDLFVFRIMRVGLRGTPAFHDVSTVLSFTQRRFYSWLKQDQNSHYVEIRSVDDGSFDFVIVFDSVGRAAEFRMLFPFYKPLIERMPSPRIFAKFRAGFRAQA